VVHYSADRGCGQVSRRHRQPLQTPRLRGVLLCGEPSMQSRDTIAAVATAQGRGGVGIVRVSGPLALSIAEALAGRAPRPRHAHYGPWRDADGQVLDEGILLYFPGPHSFTGEDVLELQGHGGPVVLDLLLDLCLPLVARQGQPSELS